MGSGVYGANDLGASDGGGPQRWRWVVLGVGLAIVAVLMILFLLMLAGFVSFAPSGSRPYFGYWGGFFVLFLLVWVSFTVLRIAFWGQRVRRGYGPRGTRRDPAVLAARQRYARGEITREQFDQIMTDLGRRGGGPGGPLSGG